MVSTFTTPSLGPLANPWQVAAGAYVIIGLIVVGVVSIRGMRRHRLPLGGGPAWEEKDSARNALFLFLAVGKWHPIGVVIEILLWPLWLVALLLSR